MTNLALNPFRKEIGIKLNNLIATALKAVEKNYRESKYGFSQTNRFG